MKKNNTKKKGGVSMGKKVAIGAGVLALGVGAYYLLGPKAKEHQKKARVLIVKIKKEVESKIRKVKNATGPMYHKAVDIISSDYIKKYKPHEKEIKALAQKLKSDWKGAPKFAKKTVKKVVRSLKNKK
ncbi:MAG: hypothetical protein WC264_03110 [Candidatus Paceibacterota bacterium]|jgi:hypothetical protein